MSDKQDDVEKQITDLLTKVRKFQITEDNAVKEVNRIVNEARQEALNYFYWRIDCNTMISELEGWRGCIDNAKD